MHKTFTSAIKPTFLFFGYGAEYSLHPLYLYMEEQGDHCIEVDMLTHPDVVGELKALVDKPLVLVTSAHLLYDDKNFFYYKTHRKVVSVLHLISTLKPIASIYYPHDLKDLIKEEELDYLSLFDLFLSPFANLSFTDLNIPYVTVGWIKNLPNSKIEIWKGFNPSRMVFLMGAYQFYLNAGFEQFYQEYKPLFDLGIAVKLPLWHQHEMFEEFLKQRNVRVYPSSANSIDVMRENDVIFTQGLSSVGIEACGLGKKVVYLKHPQLDYVEPEKEFKNIGQIVYLNSPSDISSLRIDLIPENIAVMPYFDFSKARESIWNIYFERKNEDKLHESYI